MESGITNALTLLKDDGDKARPARLLVFSDGEVNVGITDTQTLSNNISGLIYNISRKVNIGFYGFSKDISANMMVKLQKTFDKQNPIMYAEDVDKIKDTMTQWFGEKISQPPSISLIIYPESSVVMESNSSYLIKDLPERKEFFIESYVLFNSNI
jgi:hypothetical protein